MVVVVVVMVVVVVVAVVVVVVVVVMVVIVMVCWSLWLCWWLLSLCWWSLWPYSHCGRGACCLVMVTWCFCIGVAVVSGCSVGCEWLSMAVGGHQW